MFVNLLPEISGMFKHLEHPLVTALLQTRLMLAIKRSGTLPIPAGRRLRVRGDDRGRRRPRMWTSWWPCWECAWSAASSDRGTRRALPRRPRPSTASARNLGTGRLPHASGYEPLLQTPTRHHLMGPFLENFIKARYDTVAVASTGPYAHHMHLAPDS